MTLEGAWGHKKVSNFYIVIYMINLLDFLINQSARKAENYEKAPSNIVDLELKTMTSKDRVRQLWEVELLERNIQKKSLKLLLKHPQGM